MGKRVFWLVPLLAAALLAGCGQGANSPGGNGGTSKNIDDLCRVISAEEVDLVLGTDSSGQELNTDITLVYDAPFKTTKGVLEPGRHCAYMDGPVGDHPEKFDFSTTRYGLLVAVSRLDPGDWKFDKVPSEKTWLPVPLGDEGYRSTSIPLIMVRQGPWAVLLLANGSHHDFDGNEPFVEVMTDWAKLVLAALPEQLPTTN